MNAFEKIIGYEDVKAEIYRICDSMKNPEKYRKLGVVTPRGLLLCGDPGVGKTTIAEALIEESGRKSFTLRKNKPNGEFVNLIRDTFDNARKEAPSIVFLDDMDKFVNEDMAHRDAEEYVTVQTCIDDCKSEEVFVVATVNRSVPHISNLSDMPHSDNKQLMYALDAVNDAMAAKKKISFIYNNYGTDFKLYPKREEPYIVNPYQMAYCNGKFYLIGNYDKYDNVAHFRLDRMTEVRILDEKRKPKSKVKDFENGFNLPKHMGEHIYMFSGESVPVKLKTTADMMNELVDWFGKDFRLRELDDEGNIEVVVNCNQDAMFYWVLQHGPYVKVISPESLKKRIIDSIEEMAKKYKQ